MSNITLNANAGGTGIFTIASPSSNTNRTLTLPDATGTFLTTATPGIPVNGPAFSAYKSSAQTPTSSAFTKVNFETEEWDTNSNFASSRFTPTVAGYYQINSSVNFSATTGAALLSIFKNGSEYKRGVQTDIASFGVGGTNVSGCVYLNGSTDYVEIYLFLASATAITANTTTYFDGAMVRAA